MEESQVVKQKKKTIDGILCAIVVYTSGQEMGKDFKLRGLSFTFLCFVKQLLVYNILDYSCHYITF